MGGRLGAMRSRRKKNAATPGGFGHALHGRGVNVPRLCAQRQHHHDDKAHCCISPGGCWGGSGSGMEGGETWNGRGRKGGQQRA